MATANPDLPQASAADEAEIRSLLIEQGVIEDDTASAADAAGATEGAGDVFESEEEERAAAEMASEGSDGEVADEAAAEKEESEDEKIERNKAESSLARRERALVERERTAKTQITTLQNENAQLRSGFVQLKEMALSSPAGFFKALGVTELEKVAEQLYYEMVGDDKLPDTARARKATLGLERKLELLQRNIAQAEQVSAQKERAANAVRAIKAQVTGSVPEEYPLLQDEAKDDPDIVTKEVWSRIQRAISEGRAETSTPDAQLLSLAYQEIERDLVARVERTKRVHARRLAPSKPATAEGDTKAKSTTPVPPRAKSAPNTLNTKNARALTRPRAAPKNREQEIDDVVEAIRLGKAR